MKKFAITGLIILSVMFLGTCDMGPQGGGNAVEEEVAYTNVAYSEDMTQVTIYLDGTKVPVKSSRAVNTDIAQMAYDFLEVVFDAGTSGIARASWTLGQSAGISGVYRTDAGVNYDNTTNKAAIFVGKKGEKNLLLGVGVLFKVDGNGTESSPNQLITTATKSVTFVITAVKTALRVSGEALGTNPTANPFADFNSSFRFVSATLTPATPTPLPVATPDPALTNWTPVSGNEGLTVKNSIRSSLGGRSYPIYSLPVVKNYDTGSNAKVVTLATYSFSGAAVLHKALIRHVSSTDTKIVLQKRTPRYLSGGRYFELTQMIDYNPDTKVELASAYTPSNGDEFIPSVGLQFTTTQKSYGAFSWYMQIPVLAITASSSTNGGGDYTLWWISTGLGSELYSMDDGTSTGGSLMMGVGVSAVDWIEIFWKWVDNP